MSHVLDAVWPWRRQDEIRARRLAAEARDARRAGLIQGVVGLVAAFLLLRYVHPVPAALVAGIAATLALVAQLSPLGAFARVRHGVGRFAHGVGLAVTWLTLPVVFLLVFWPLGALLQAGGKLRLRRDPDPDADTYWRPADEWPRSLDDYRRQF
jgi:hypothetical protein